MAARKQVDPRAAAMSEKALDLRVRRLLRDLGLSRLAFHPPDGVGGFTPGWPDWTIAGSHVMFRELKAEKGRVSPEQKIVLAHLEAIGADVGIWKPTDLLSGRIAAELASIADPASRARAAGLDELAMARKAKTAGKRPGKVVRRRAA